eukprot:6020043-Pleurochrysis_carterae.AAC.1
MRGEHSQSGRKVRVPHSNENKTARVIKLKGGKVVTPHYKERHISETERVESPPRRAPNTRKSRESGRPEKSRGGATKPSEEGI